MIKSIRLRWAGHIDSKEEGSRTFKIVKGKPRRKEPLGWPRHTREDNIRMHIEEVGVSIRN